MQEKAILSVHKEVFPFLNISLYLNNIKPIYSLTIENSSEVDSEPVEIQITSDLPCIEAFSYSLENVPAKKSIKIPLEKLKLNREFLNSISETEKMNISVRVIQNENTILTDDVTIDVHPIEYFGGFQVLPELIASYVTPNHPYIYHIKRKAAEELEKQGLKISFEGYQNNDPERVLQLMSAIYSAIQSEGIVYSSLPPGYEALGQRLRLLNTIQRENFGNCIDISLLFAACFESIDLNPVLIITQGHAFVGSWLQDDKFSEIINDDKTAITKRLSKGIREMAAIEATSICKGNNIGFSDALNMGEAQLVQKEDFIISIDIKRARFAQIRPLPLLTNTTNVQLDETEIKRVEAANMEKNFKIGTIYQDILPNESKPTTKLKIWERKLLDLSLRNNLLNLRITRNMLQIVDIDISHLEDVLSEGKSFSILPNQLASVLRKYNLFYQTLHHSSPMFQMANDELKYNNLLTHYHREDLDKILTYIHKNAKLSIEENGASTLYLAVGLLKWYDRKLPEQPRYAPILLLPVEINRRTVNSKFTLKNRGEETMINMTLLEFLRQEYELNLSGLEQLPYDEKGVDVAKVMGTLRRAVMQLKGWDVEEQLVLGNFSFNKLILWKDITTYENQLQKSDLVKSLIDGKLSLSKFNNNKNNKNTDLETILSQNITLPIPTDVSQMEAVLTAQAGESFVLHGPPGTGKSQTITNIIADAMFRGKRVLFVAAKKAALDVVHRRLEHIGLAPFTLELHSNKSKKSDVLEQLSRSLETTKLNSTANFEQESLRLDEAKKPISNYVNVLHQKQAVGWSLFDSISILENYKNNSFNTNFIPELVFQHLNNTLWQRWEDWLPQFQTIIRLISHPKENILSNLNINSYSQSLVENISNQSQALVTAIENVEQLSLESISALQFPFSIQSKTEYEHFIPLIKKLQNIETIPTALCNYLSSKENISIHDEWIINFQKYLSIKKNILTDFNRNVFNIDIPGIEIQWKHAKQTWFLPKWLKKKKITKQLTAYRNSPITADDEVEQLFTSYNQLQDLQILLQQSRFKEVQLALKNLYKEDETDILQLAQISETIKSLSGLINNWEYNGLNKWTSILLNNDVQYLDDIKDKYSPLLTELMRANTLYNEHKDSYEALTGINFRHTADYLQEIKNQIESIHTHLPELKSWINYKEIVQEGKKLHLDWMILAYENQLYTIHEAADYFYYTVHASIIKRTIAQHESLSLFNKNLFESKIEQYKKIAKNYQLQTIQELRVKLSANLPNATFEAMQSSEIGILQRAIKNRGRGLSIRKLFDQIPTLLPRLAPCMLMSPISVAQYFNADINHFDLVIFDEASQLPTCEAVSALARAKQAVIVGDPQQMPPTSFFSSVKTDEENMSIEDLESILDDCLSLSVPSKYLLRHYRSKHESLIAFSNVNYYDNKLLTFPSSDDLNRKVKYHHIPGQYDKGKSRTNKFEADAIVQYIIAHYTNEEKRKLTLGVVTFSQTQQNLIEDKLNQAFAADPELEKNATDTEEPLFIKNLENVQGDERDIILFSVGYAADETGKVSMNFGPLNREGGWRRLNVAVTRARYEMHIFATLRSDQIDLSRTSAKGVEGLKGFLQFAEKGQLIISPKNAQCDYKKQHLSEIISSQLKAKGLIAKCNIGTSDFKIDIGIVHPDRPEQYILGILLDGYYYYNARTSNDREMVMPSVLKVLGWNIYRIWTIDWHENSTNIIKDIIEKVVLLQKEIILEKEKPEESIKSPAFNSVKQREESLHKIVTRQKPYESASITSLLNANSVTIYDFANREKIKQQIQKIIFTEEPVSKNLLYKKLLQAWNVSRTGSKLDNYLGEIIKEINPGETLHHQPFYWRANSIKTIDFYRNNDSEKRNMEDIAPEELIVAINEALEQNLSIEEEELLRYIARLFGFSKVGKQIDEILRYCVDLTIKTGKIKREGVRLIVNG